jgi:hypothetical protein
MNFDDGVPDRSCGYEDASHRVVGEWGSTDYIMGGVCSPRERGENRAVTEVEEVVMCRSCGMQLAAVAAYS